MENQRVPLLRIMEKKDNVGQKHPQYDAAAQARKIWQDVADGGTLKLRKERKTYFPQFPKEDEADYKYRCDTSTVFNLTRKTRDVMVGLLFQEPIELEGDVPAQMETLWEDTDNRGTHGDVFWREAATAAFEGYAVILEDAPVEKARDAGEEKVLGLRPYSILYRADDVWNARYRINPVSKRRELEMIVLRSITDEPDGQFLVKPITRFLHIQADLQGKVTWERFIEKKKEEGGEVEYIDDGNGVFEKQDSIPVAILRELWALPPFIDIALKNIEHTQTYSDYKHIIHKTCVPFPVRKGYEPPKDNEPTTNSVVIDVPIDGDFSFAEVAGSSIEAVRTSLIDNREDISLMGLSILADKTAKVDLTATEALLNNIGETAELRVLGRATQDAIETSFGFRAKYLGQKDGGSIVMGTAWNKAEREAEKAAEAAVTPPIPFEKAA